MTAEITNASYEQSHQPSEQNQFPFSAVIFDATDPNNEQLSREERIKLYYARELASDNLDVLLPRYRSSEYNSDDPNQDILVADPLSDPDIGKLALILKASGYKPEAEVGEI